MKHIIPIDVHGTIQNVNVDISPADDERKFDIYKFHGGETHADYHFIEENKLVCVHIDDSGNDYWDLDSFYVKEEFEKIAKIYFSW